MMRLHARFIVGAALLLALPLGLASGSARADDANKLRVVCTLPHLAAIAREVGGDRVEAVSLGRGDQDPHYIQPTPTLMVEANKADLYVEVGMELELWSEHVVDGARNEKIRVSFPGHVVASQGVTAMQVPQIISRSQGDIHPYGNPHIWVSPINGVIEARNIAEGLKRVDPPGAADYDRRLADFTDRLVKAYVGEDVCKLLGGATIVKLAEEGKLVDFLETKKFKGEPLSKRVGGWLGKMLPYRGAKLVAYHQEWCYFARDFGVEIEEFIEDKPGIPPSPGHLQDVKEYIKAHKVPAIVYSPYFSISNFETLGQETGAKIVLLPTDVGGVPEAKDYFSLFDAIVGRIAEACASAKAGG